MARLRVLSVCLVLVACSTTRSSSGGPMDAALRAVNGGGGTPREQGLAGWHRYLVEGDAAAAQKLFDAAPNDLVAQSGALELARRDLNLGTRVRLAVRVATLGARDPLGEAAAHTMISLLGQAPHLDAELSSGAEGILRHPASPAVAFLARVVVARVAALEGKADWAQRFADAGGITAYAAVGPFGPLHALSFPEVYPPETAFSLEPKYATAVGEVHTRTLLFPSADVALSGEPPRGDVYYLAADFTAKGGAYVLLTGGAVPHAVWIDGVRRELRGPVSLGPVQDTASLSLAPGPHRILLKMLHAGSGQVSVFLARGDGAAEDLHARPAQGPAPKAAPPPARSPDAAPLPRMDMGAADTYAQLLPELGPDAARYVAVRVTAGRDLEGAKALLAAETPWPKAAAWRVLRAQLTLSDHSLPNRTAHGRASRDLEAATTQDPHDASAWLLRASEARDADQLDDAKDFLSKAAAAARSAIVTVNQARLALAHNLDAPADALARQALELLPGYCDAVGLRFDVARRRDAMAETAGLAKELTGCPGALDRQVDLARARSDFTRALALSRQKLQRSPTQWRAALALAQVEISAGKLDAAEQVLRAQVALWPRNAELHKQLASVLTLAGRATDSLAEKRAALALDGSDLSLRRELALAQGHELLDAFAVDDREVIAKFEKAPKPASLSGAASAYVLDLAGIKVLPDGTQIERIHTIAKVLDQRGIAQLAEQHLPSGAVPLKLQTLKQDGRVLEPEVIGDKSGVSLPDVQVGDYIDVEYLNAVSPRSAAEPGWATVPFYFRTANAPLFLSTCTVEAPAGTKVEVDAHNMKAPVPQTKGGQVVVHHEAHQVPLLIPEPGAPGANEYLPFMQVGVGAGSESVLEPFADAVVGHAAPTLEVARFARQAAGALQGEAAVRAVFAAVSQKVKGAANDIDDRASFTLARERGSRLWLLKGALDALGIPSRVALVRSLRADPSRYRFPNTSLFTYPVLYVPLASGPLWLDPSVRFGPFNALPDAALGGRQAILLAEPGSPQQTVTTPPMKAPTPKVVKLRVQLHAQGDVTASGQESYTGFDAAYLRQALDRYDDAQRKQAIEVALSRSFHGVTLEKLEVRTSEQVGAPLTIEYSFKSPGFARVVPGKLVLASPIFPLSLGERFVALAARTTPLLIADAQASKTEIRIALPAGFTATELGKPAQITSPFGHFRRAAELQGHTLVIDEDAQIDQGRIAPGDYPAFVKFTAAVDQAQQQSMSLTERAGPASAPTAGPSARP